MLTIIMLNLVMVRLSSKIQRRTTIGSVSTRKTQKAWLISLDKFLLGVITTI